MRAGKPWLMNGKFVFALVALLLLPAQLRADWYSDLSDTDWLKFDWTIETTNDSTGDNTGNDFVWTSNDPIDPFTPYQYRAEITIVDARVILGALEVWTPVTELFPPEDRDTGFLLSSEFPFEITGGAVHVDDGAEPVPNLALDVILFHGVAWNDSTNDYRLISSLTDAVFGDVPELGWPITGFRATARTAMRPVPEPGSLVLLGIGGLAGLVFLRRRRK